MLYDASIADNEKMTGLALLKNAAIHGPTLLEVRFTFVGQDTSFLSFIQQP